VGITVEAFNKLEWPLVIVGEGPELSRLKKIAQPNIKFLGYQPDDVVRDYYAGCLGFIMPQEEDFGITPIEAMSFGKPVLALRRGGALEYMREGINGEFFDDPVEEVLADGVRRLKEGIETGKYDPETIKKTAERFSAERFKREIRESVFPAERI
jgi:glycosyltransferase involved in cell wall biosynthesis